MAIGGLAWGDGPGTPAGEEGGLRSLGLGRLETESKQPGGKAGATHLLGRRGGRRKVFGLDTPFESTRDFRPSRFPRRSNHASRRPWSTSGRALAYQRRHWRGRGLRNSKRTQTKLGPSPERGQSVIRAAARVDLGHGFGRLGKPSSAERRVGRRLPAWGGLCPLVPPFAT